MPTVERNEAKLPSGANCENQSLPTNSINYITCISANFERQLNMLSPYQLKNLTSSVNGDLLLLERKYRAPSHLDVRGRLSDIVPCGLLRRYALSSPQSSRRVFITPGNYT